MGLDDGGRLLMEYKGYVAAVEFDDSANVLHGRVVNSGSYPIANFECTDVGALRQEFERSIDEYLTWCREDNVVPKQPQPWTPTPSDRPRLALKKHRPIALPDRPHLDELRKELRGAA